MKVARILVLADEPVKAFWDFYQEDRFKDIDLIISCGDLPASYLSFIATMFRGDVLYIPGNHDERYLVHPPEGCVNIDGRIFEWRGLRIMGLGGSYRYKPGPYQYDESEMYRRYLKMKYQLWRKGGIDIFVTHAPALGLNDGKDLPHRGFETFLDILEKYTPKIYVHGHVHMNYGNYPRLCKHGDTIVVNAYERYVLEVPLPQENPTRFWKRKEIRLLSYTPPAQEDWLQEVQSPGNEDHHPDKEADRKMQSQRPVDVKRHQSYAFHKKHNRR